MMACWHTLFTQPPAGEVADGWTYADFAAATQYWAQALHKAEVKSVALWFDDAARLASALAATWLAGADAYLLPDLSDVSQQWAQQHDCILFGDDEAFADAAWLYRREHEHARHQGATLTFPAENRIFLKTSASSGAAKTIGKSRKHMEREAAALAQVLPENWRGATALASISAQHLYGLSFRVFAALACGWRIGRTRHSYPEDLIAAAKQHSACLWLTSPALLNRLGGQRDWAALRPTLRGVVSAGGMLPVEVSRQLHQHLGFYPHNVYGSTETGVIAIQQDDAHVLLPAVAARIRSAGSLAVRSPWTDGTQSTADSAELHGRKLVLHGRSDRIIKLADKRISLARIEQLLLAHPYIADAHCLRHPQHGRIAAWLALNDEGIAAWRKHGRNAMIAELKRNLDELKPLGAVPRHWRFADSLPRNPQAKIRAADAENALLHPPTAPNWHALPAEHTDERTFEGIIPLDLPYFGGHFAQFPLVPGVVQLQWVMALALPEHAPTQIENLKFQKFIRPHDRIQLFLRHNSAKNKIYFSLRLPDGSPCASGRIALSVSE
ncbi:AMP-binding protein [Conchiformibius steedae]|uniref:AMP-binding enzyme family protein n=1 Tax=Conchiformibius steedae TaxID=153493 RepID=A0A3P2A561_9NEIS|nr:AMP-binding protein [Conchiformibius steedae]RRD90038.1 AMP-binding enzyme family protein [Conchiformibius steedae]